MYFDLRVLIRWFLLEIIILGRSGSEQCTTELTLARKTAFLPTILEPIEYILHEMHMQTYVLYTYKYI